MVSDGRNNIRIVVADDNTLMRQGVVSLFAASPDIEVVGEASNGTEALDVVEILAPDVLLLDLRMPEVDGHEVLRRLQEQRSTCRVVVLSMEDRRWAEPRVRDQGAWGYVDKVSDIDTLREVVRKVAVASSIEAAHFSASAPGAPEDVLLSNRQREVLELLIKGRTNSEIAEELWISERIVKHHVAGILAFYGVQRRSQAVAKATLRGLLPEGDQPVMRDEQR